MELNRKEIKCFIKYYSVPFLIRNGDEGLSGGRLMSDFDMMLEKKRADMKKRRKKKDINKLFFAFPFFTIF